MILLRKRYATIYPLLSKPSPYSYEWDEKFSVKNFTEAIDKFNDRERTTVSGEWTGYSENDDEFDLPAKRVTYATSINDVLSPAKDLAIPVVTTTEFVEFANELIMKALNKKGLPNKIPLEILTGPTGEDELVLAVWRLDKILNWQVVDRQIDEYVFICCYCCDGELILSSSGSGKSYGPFTEPTNASHFPNSRLASTTSRQTSPSGLSGPRKRTKARRL